ncbi:zinc finger protein 287-like [Plutella xylostella]|uniref:zinc finger protein 287-like n=1 Tax=Plutella xylostella TaxID=51655 RepID=UPI002032D218|nr:zinc finger protein 287-like [Plutella xylostella]
MSSSKFPTAIFSDKKRTYSSTGVVKIKEEKPTCVEKLANIRRNIALLLHYGNVTPFQWMSTRFKCFYCSKDITDCDNLISHTNQKHSNLHLEEFIKKRVKSKDVPIKLDVQNIACKVCLEPIDSLQGLISHIIQTHEDNYDVEVGVCAFPFVLTKDEYACTQCEDRFDNFSSLVSHMYKIHVSHSYVCQICGLSFLYKDRMMRHFNNSHVGYRCSICKKMFEGQKTLARHKELKHGQVKVHNCSLCSLRFYNDYQLKVHMGKAHNVEKFVIKCEMCPKVCNTKGALLIHMQSKHSEATYECDMCDYKASIKWLIKLHKRKHLGERDYECSICKRKFGRSSNLRTHMKVHTGNFGRVCRKCRHGFVDVEELRSHEREVHYVD